MQHLRLTHPELDFWVDVRLREFDGKWLAATDYAGEPDIGTSEDPREAVREALRGRSSSSPRIMASRHAA